MPGIFRSTSIRSHALSGGVPEPFCALHGLHVVPVLLRSQLVSESRTISSSSTTMMLTFFSIVIPASPSRVGCHDRPATVAEVRPLVSTSTTVFERYITHSLDGQ